MGVTEELRARLKESMFARDEIRTRVLRLLISAVKNEEVSKKRALTKDEFDAIVKKQIKERNEAIEDYKRGGREDLLKEEEKERDILKEFAMPELSDEEVKDIVSKIVEKENVTSAKEIGKVMGAAMKELKRKASGERVRKIAERLLQFKK